MPSSLLGYVFVILNILPSLVLTSGIAFAQQPEYDLSAGPNGISVFRSTSAVLTGVPGSPFVTTAQALNLASDMTGQFVYATLSNGSVAGFTMDASTGELTPVSGMPISTGTIANQLRVHPSGRFVYVSNLSVTNPTGSVSGFLVNQTTGALTPLPGSPYASSVSGFDLALDPTGAYLYVAGNLGGVAIMAVDQNTGVLIPVSGSPFPLGTNLASIVVHPNGRYVYAADFRFDCCGTAGSLWAFQYDPTSGRVTTVPGSPYFVVSPHWVATDPSGAYLYAASTHGNGVYGYTINQSTGALTSISGSPFPAGQGAVSIAVDSTGQFAYQGASAVSQDITSYSINGLTGGLSRIGLPFAPAPGNSILVVRPVHAVVPVIVPSQGGNNGLVSFQLFGSGFESGATVVLSGGGVNISATNVRVTNTSLLTGTFNLFGVAPGLLDVTITNPDNSINTLPNAFTVQQGGTTQISASLIGRDKIRFGTPQTYYIQVSNTGTIDSEPGLVTLSVPSSITGSQSSGTSLFAAGTTETLFPETFTSVLS